MKEGSHFTRGKPDSRCLEGKKFKQEKKRRRREGRNRAALHRGKKERRNKKPVAPSMEGLSERRRKEGVPPLEKDTRHGGKERNNLANGLEIGPSSLNKKKDGTSGKKERRSRNRPSYMKSFLTLTKNLKGK